MGDLIAEKYLLVPDCDDDRYADGKPVNPRHPRASQEVYCKHRVRVMGALVRGYQGDGGVIVPCRPDDAFSGWHPPQTLVLGGGDRREATPAERASGVSADGKRLRLRAGVKALWYRQADGLHRICVWGGDDFALEKSSMTEAKARAMWSRLRDFITRKTLEQRLGFVFW